MHGYCRGLPNWQLVQVLRNGETGMIRREFMKLAAVGAGILGLPGLAGARLRPLLPGKPLFISAEIGVFFPLSRWSVACKKSRGSTS